MMVSLDNDGTSLELLLLTKSIAINVGVNIKIRIRSIWLLSTTVECTNMQIEFI